MMRSGSNRSRRGYTLIEMLLVITGLAIVFGICVGMIHLLIRLDRGSRVRLAETTTIARLARQFRQDVHAAAAVRRIAGKDDAREGVELTLPEGRKVEYVREGDRLLRFDQSKAKALVQEAYRLPSRTRPKFEVREETDRTWALLILPPNPDAKDIVAPRSVIVKAWVGKHARLGQREEVTR